MAMSATDLAAERKAAVAAIAAPGAEATEAEVQDYIDACMLADSTAIVDHIANNAEIKAGEAATGIPVTVDTGTGEGATTAPGAVTGGVE